MSITSDDEWMSRDGFSTIPRFLLGHPKMTVHMIGVYVALMARVNARTEECYPGHARIGKEAGGLSVSTVQRALDALRELGVLSWEGTLGGTNTYRLHPGGLVLAAVDLGPEDRGVGLSDRGGSVPVTEGVGHTDRRTRAMNESQKNENSPSTADAVEADGDRDTLDLQPLRANTPTEDDGRMTAADVLQEFDRWWSTWPRKVGKRDAAKAYAVAVRDVTPFVLADAAARFAAHIAAVGRCGKHTVHPATWLRQGRWDDDLDAVEGCPPKCFTDSRPAWDRPSSGPTWETR